MGPEFLKKSLLNSTVKDKDMEPFSENNNTGMFRGGASYADAITFGAEKVDKKLMEEFAKVRPDIKITMRAPYESYEDGTQKVLREAVTNQILDDLVQLLDPREMTVVGDFTARGGISTSVTASHRKA